MNEREREKDHESTDRELLSESDFVIKMSCVRNYEFIFNGYCLLLLLFTRNRNKNNDR